MMRTIPGLRGALAAIATALAASQVPACSGSCSDIGCIQAFTITPEHPFADEGDYEVDFVVDDEPITCTVKVPSTAPARCSNSRAYVFQEAGTGIEFLSMDGKVKTVAVTVRFEGKVVARQTFEPEYEPDEINGPGCGTCLAARDTLKPGAPEPDGGVPPTDAGVPPSDASSSLTDAAAD